MWPNSDTLNCSLLSSLLRYSSTMKENTFLSRGTKGQKKVRGENQEAFIMISKLLFCVLPITPLPVLLNRLPRLSQSEAR